MSLSKTIPNGAVEIKGPVTFVPSEGRYLVEISPSQDLSRGGIALPNNMVATLSSGKVLKRGAALKTNDGHIFELEHPEGSEVLFLTSAGVYYEHNERKCKILSPTEVLGRME